MILDGFSSFGLRGLGLSVQQDFSIQEDKPEIVNLAQTLHPKPYKAL